MCFAVKRIHNIKFKKSSTSFLSKDYLQCKFLLLPYYRYQNQFFWKPRKWKKAARGLSARGLTPNFLNKFQIITRVFFPHDELFSTKKIFVLDIMKMEKLEGFISPWWIMVSKLQVVLENCNLWLPSLPKMS